MGIKSSVSLAAMKVTDAHDYWSTASGTVDIPTPSLIIDMAQPQGQLAKSLLEPGSDFEPEFAAWLRRGLATDAEERFRDASIMQAEWRTLMRSAEANARLMESPQANGGGSPARQPWWRRVIGR